MENNGPSSLRIHRRRVRGNKNRWKFVFPPFLLNRWKLTFPVFLLFAICYWMGLRRGGLGGWQTFTRTQQGSSPASLCASNNTIVGGGADGSLDSQPARHTMDIEERLENDPGLEPCQPRCSEYTPCEDVECSGGLQPQRALTYRKRHCPDRKGSLRCLIPVPPGYRKPLPWPASRELVWYANVPHMQLSIKKNAENWIRLVGNKFQFPGGGTMFPDGIKAYIDEMNALLPQLSDGTIRTALDIGCGVASWGAYLLDWNILTMSFAPRDTDEAQVLFALERGVPAMLGVMASNRLPYPARAFDMAHCSHCLIPWAKYDGLYLMEVDRVLRPGGYWILSGPPISWRNNWRGWERSKEELMKDQESIEDVARRLCWTKLAEKGNLAIWQKPWNHLNCSKSFKTPPLCDSHTDPDAWYKSMEGCITPLPRTYQGKKGMILKKWPMRLTAVSPRISNKSIWKVADEDFMEDMEVWKIRVSYYVNSLIPLLGKNGSSYRNIMDMNAGIGGFAAALALAEYNSWVMNVVPTLSIYNTLGVIYERGLIGTYQDWCEAFSTYPRTYDLIHADAVFSMYQHKCDVVDILLEMDRILRPEGTIIIRDEGEVLVKVARKVRGMRWETRLVDHEGGPLHSQKILIALKKFWVSGDSISTSSQ